MRFKKGQKVVCTHNGHDGFWRTVNSKIIYMGPDYNDVVTVSGYCEFGLVEFYEWPTVAGEGYNDVWFEPLMDISELTEILEHQPEHA